MTFPQALDVGRGVGQVCGARVPAVRIDQGDAKAKVVSDVPHCSGEVGVVGYDDCLLVLSAQPMEVVSLPRRRADD